MNKEEKEAVEHLKETSKDRMIIPLDDEILIAVNLIEKLQKENEELKNKLKEKDKIINLMVNHIATSDSYLCQYLDITTKCKYYAGENGNTCDECIKQYFERQAKNDTKYT